MTFIHNVIFNYAYFIYGYDANVDILKSNEYNI